ncbi:MAG: AtpZ/AtpI family protein [Candidatus Andeanibacterium colombiense]|uniref:ATP synthase protein I n=1 Tax=Candidatus Andeanibacterium colombiense TaxID=3121345 RepID=A0AAJ5X810_9SPHN|nr:MAG: AtpZ/AtpI family protein [Sphingomonadaceae bacterium]
MTESGGNDGKADLDRRIDAAKQKLQRGVTPAEGRAETRGWAIGIEFVGTVLVAGFIGWMIDNWIDAGTRPWAMIALLLLGFAAGVRRAMQTSREFDAEPGNDPAD